MFNLTIETVEFVRPHTQEYSVGYIIRDKYHTAYNDRWNEIPQDEVEILKFVLKDVSDRYDENIVDMFEAISFDKKEGVIINGKHYEWKTIKDLVEEALCSKSKPTQEMAS